MRAPPPQWDDLKTVLHVVRGGSLAAAATVLGVNYTTVARRISRLETCLKQTLFERRAEGYLATQAGLDVARYAAEMEERDHALMRHLSGQDTRLKGRFTVTAPQLLIASHLAPVLEDFSAQNPDIELEVRATNALLNLNQREADLAIRISSEPGDTLIGQRLTKQYTAAFATPKMAQKIAENPQDPIDWVAYSNWKKAPLASLIKHPRYRIKMRFDDMIAMIGAAKAGVGVVRLPMFLGRSTDGLIQVPVMEPQPYQDIWVLTHRDLKSSAKVRAFKDILLPYFKAHVGDFVV